MKRLLTMDDVVEITRLSKATIYAYVCRREIPCIKLGTRTLFNEDVVLKWIEERAVSSVNQSSQE